MIENIKNVQLRALKVDESYVLSKTQIRRENEIEDTNRSLSFSDNKASKTVQTSKSIFQLIFSLSGNNMIPITGISIILLVVLLLFVGMIHYFRQEKLENTTESDQDAFDRRKINKEETRKEWIL